MEGLAEAGGVEPALVEGEVDDRALRAQRLERAVEAVGAGAGLEDHVGAAAVGAVPAALGLRPGVVLGKGLEAEAAGDGAPPVGGLGDEDLGTGAAGEERGEQADRAGAPDDDRAAGDAGAERRAATAERLGVGMEDAVGADRTHLGDEDAEDRVDLRRQGDQELVGGIGGVAGLVAEGAGDGERRARSRGREEATTSATSM